MELGGFARAAERLGVSTSAVSRHVADLAGHECLTYTHIPVPNSWPFESRDGAIHTVRIEPRHRGRLVQLLPGFELPGVPIAAVYPSRRHLSAKVRGFVDFLAERFWRAPERSLPPASTGAVDSRS